jgi:hypothetical protein
MAGIKGKIALITGASGRRLTEIMIEDADEPTVVADAVLKAASPAHPKLRYSVGGCASGLPLLRRFFSGRMIDAGIRKDLRLDAPTASMLRTPALAKSSIQNWTVLAESPYHGSREHDAI